MLNHFLHTSWHWSASGAAIALILFLLAWNGKVFGVSTIFRNFCGLAGARDSFFRFDYREDGWRLFFLAGAMVGGFFAGILFPDTRAVDLNPATIAALADWGIAYPGADSQGRGLFPDELLRWNNLQAWLIALGGGFLLGFGSRYADGCTSGHAITGLSHLQLPSLLTVIGFFIGGLLMTHFFLPYIL